MPNSAERFCGVRVFQDSARSHQFSSLSAMFSAENMDSSGLWWRPWSFGDPIQPLGAKSAVWDGFDLYWTSHTSNHPMLKQRKSCKT